MGHAFIGEGLPSIVDRLPRIGRQDGYPHREHGEVGGVEPLEDTLSHQTGAVQAQNACEEWETYR